MNCGQVHDYKNIMICDLEIHNDLIDMGEMSCPFCDSILQNISDEQINICCDKQNVRNVDGQYVCVNCGQVQGYEEVNDFIDFYDDLYKIRRKSVYGRKYHIENVIRDICTKNKLQISRNQINCILKVFNEINKILPQVNIKRKRMISIIYILKQLFEMLKIPHNSIQITKLKKTLVYYQQYWDKVKSLLGDKIDKIINK